MNHRFLDFRNGIAQQFTEVEKLKIKVVEMLKTIMAENAHLKEAINNLLMSLKSLDSTIANVQNALVNYNTFNNSMKAIIVILLIEISI